MNGSVDSNVPHSIATIEGQRAVWLGGPHCVRHEAVGEALNPEQMTRVIATLHGRTDTPVIAWLVPDGSNPQNPSVMIWVLGGRVGYLPRELGHRWYTTITQFRNQQNCKVACQATLDPPSAANQGGFGIVVWLPPLGEIGVRPQHNPALTPSSTGPVVIPEPSRRESPPVPRAPERAQQISVAAAPRPAVPAANASALSDEARDALHREVAAAKAELMRLKAEVESVEEALEIQSFGFYKPKYGFESSEKYVMRLAGIREDQKALIKEDKAAPCDTKWTVGGSAAEGRKMVKQQAKLMLRAFNGECDAAIAKVRYDNVTKLEQRLTKAYDDINKLGQVQQVYISRRYFDLKLAELHLVHEHREKVQEEKEEQKRIREQMREEQKVQEELDRAQAAAESEEKKSAAALEKAKADLAAAEATGKQHERLESDRSGKECSRSV